MMFITDLPLGGTTSPRAREYVNIGRLSCEELIVGRERKKRRHRGGESEPPEN